MCYDGSTVTLKILRRVRRGGYCLPMINFSGSTMVGRFLSAKGLITATSVFDSRVTIQNVRFTLSMLRKGVRGEKIRSATCRVVGR